ncbi:helix-turn-helix domain-containing protein [Aminobacter ciceronei]|uniref:helix-turn-helix domain-containing protein n=1 Tax=Aminobacter ciceronei TaxID=150723 RepID=UPI003F6E9C6B
MTIEDGDVCLLDLGRAFTSQFSAGSGLPLVLPRAPLDRALAGRPLDGLLKAGLPVTRLISDLILSLDRLPSMGIAVALAIEEAVTTLLVSVIAGRTIDELPEDPVLSRIFRQRVLQFIDAHLHRPDLDLALLMQQFRVSRAHLYRMFAGDNGGRAIIRDRRLNAAYRQLLSHRGKTGSITSIAHKLGFSSSNQFLRAFREQFGVTPSEVRHEGMSSGEAERGLQAHLRKVKR